MNALFWIVLASVLIAVSSVASAALFLRLPEAARDRFLPHLISFAIGTLLGAAFIALLPHALESQYRIDVHRVTATVLFGLVGFFLLEKMVLWRHCHRAECEVHSPEQVRDHVNITGSLILVGDSVHNLIHGFLIAASFLSEFHLGVVTSIAVAAHQVPQELGNFAVLLHHGYERRRAFVYNMLTSLVGVAGGVLGYYGLVGVAWLIPYMLAVAVAACIYIAVADLIPGLHKRPQIEVTAQQVTLIAAGVGSIYLTHLWLH